MVAIRAKFAEQYVEPLGFRNKDCRTQHFPYVELFFSSVIAQQVLSKENAKYIVLVFLYDRKTGMCSLDDKGNELIRTFYYVEDVHSRPGTPDIPNLHLGHL